MNIPELIKALCESAEWADRLERAIFEARLSDAIELKELYKKWKNEVGE